MADSFEYTPCPLQFYEFKPLDHKKNCLTYEASLHKPVVPDELDKLHADLSLLRENVQNRIQLLTSEMTILNEWQVKRDYNKRKHVDDSQSSSRSSKSHPHDASSDPTVAPPSKRTKTESHSSTGVGSGSSSKSSKRMRGKSKAHPPGPPQEPSQDENQPIIDSSALIKIKPDTTDKFWSNVEPYCADITEEDLKMLQEFGSANDQGLFEVPPLGPHYSRQWGVQDLAEEATGSRQEHLMSSSKLEAEGLLLDGMSQNMGNGGPGSLGPLTQRLMTAFLEDPAGSNKIAPTISKPSSSLPPISPTVFESKLKEELISLGLFEPPNESQKEANNETEDEILKEIEKSQAELKKVIEYNKQQKKMLHSLARAEMRRQDIRRKLQEIDTELMETLRRFASYRQKKKREPISRKDKESTEKLLETRQRLVSQLLV